MRSYSVVEREAVAGNMPDPPQTASDSPSGLLLALLSAGAEASAGPYGLRDWQGPLTDVPITAAARPLPWYHWAVEAPLWVADQACLDRPPESRSLSCSPPHPSCFSPLQSWHPISPPGY